MHLKQIYVKNFRNYTEATVNFSTGINILIGENAQGKTSLLEAIYVLALARSHRTHFEREMLRWGSEKAYISGEVVNRYGNLPLTIQFDKQEKIAKANQLKCERLSQYIGKLNVVLFAPEDLDLVKGQPQNRRQFIDRELSQMSPLYLNYLLNYQHLLKQRNTYLKQLQKKEATDRLYLEILSEQLASLAAKIIKIRVQFICQLNNWAKPMHQAISREAEQLNLKYETSIGLPEALLNQAPTASLAGLTEADRMQNQTIEKDIEAQLLVKFKQLQEREIERGISLIGPHRDDLLVLINEQDVKRYGSQGQQRTCVLSLKLAELECMKAILGEYPILLLDDVLSELDNERQTHLLKAIEKRVQTFLTTTSLQGIHFPDIALATCFEIKQGQVTEKTRHMVQPKE